MESKFEPTQKDLLTIDSRILDIKQDKALLVQRKTSLQNSLSQLKDKYRSLEFNGKDFHRVKNTRNNVKNHMHGIELKIKALNDELLMKNKLRLEIDFYLRNNKRLESREDLERIEIRIGELKKKYRDFGKDRTRIASLRIMANEIYDELDKLTK